MSRTPRLLALALVVAACDSTSPSPNPLTIVTGGNYIYTAYSALGRPALTGTVHLDWVVTPAAGTPPRPLGGTWDIRWQRGADSSIQVGPQLGTGTLDGVAADTGVQLSFEPNMVDYGVSLSGVVYGDNMSGTWTYFTLAGPSQQGHFTLIAAR